MITPKKFAELKTYTYESVRNWVKEVSKFVTEDTFHGCMTKKCGIQEGEMCPKHKVIRVMTLDMFMALFGIKEEDLYE